MTDSQSSLLKRVCLYVFIGCFVLLHIYVKLATKPSFESAGFAGARAGQKAVAFVGTTLDHQTIQLATVAKAHKLTILNFWESWCGPCKLEMPDLQTLYASNKEKGLEIIGISGASDSDSLAQIIRDDAVTFPVITDLNNTINRQYGIVAVPTTIVLDAHLKILRSHEGIDAGLRAFVEDYLSKQGKQGT
jgi:peroxiredoxin